MSDAAFTDCQRTRGTHYGVVVSVFGCPVVAQAKMFKTKPLSTAEAEFMAAFEGHKLAKWVAMLAQECGLKVQWPLRQLVDNMACLYMATKPNLSGGRARHMELRWFWLQEEIAARKVWLGFIPTEFQQADALTKAIGDKSDLRRPRSASWANARWWARRWVRH